MGNDAFSTGNHHGFSKRQTIPSSPSSTSPRPPPADALVGPASDEWETTADGKSLWRTLRGAELLINFQEQHCDGNFQLTFHVTITTSLTAAQLRARAGLAWWNARTHHPVIGLSLVTVPGGTEPLCATPGASPSADLTRGIFTPHLHPASARAWVESTCDVVSDGRNGATVSAEKTRVPLSTPGKHATLTLVTDAERGPGDATLVLCISHALSGHDALPILECVADQLARVRGDDEGWRVLGLGGVDGRNDGGSQFTPEDTPLIRGRLPASATHEFLTRTPVVDSAALSRVAAQQREAQARWARHSVGMPVRTDWEKRPSRMQNQQLAFERDEARTAMEELKAAKISITTAFFACMTSAFAQLFSLPSASDAAPEGAHLLFSAHASRWMQTRPSSKRSNPISMAIVPGGMWIDAKRVRLDPADREGLVKLAREIAKQQTADISDPHIIPLLDQMAHDVVESAAQPAPKQTQQQQESKSSSPPPVLFARPTLTSQGTLCVSREHSYGPTRLQVTDYGYAGRNAEASVCFALYRFRDELRVTVIHDERYFAQEDVLRLANRTCALFREAFCLPQRSSMRPTEAGKPTRVAEKGDTHRSRRTESHL